MGGTPKLSVTNKLYRLRARNELNEHGNATCSPVDKVCKSIPSKRRRQKFQEWKGKTHALGKICPLNERGWQGLNTIGSDLHFGNCRTLVKKRLPLKNIISKAPRAQLRTQYSFHQQTISGWRFRPWISWWDTMKTGARGCLPDRQRSAARNSIVISLRWRVPNC